MREATCNDCKFSILLDYGYSNYTVEGTTFRCAANAHPEDGFDNWYGEDKRLLFAQICDKFEAGDGISMDVEGECESELTPEQKAIWEAL